MPFGEEIGAGVGPRTEALKYSYTGSDNIRKRFTGYEKDVETGLDFAEARMYESRHGRFTAVDPLLASASAANPQTFNRYIYTGNNPINFTDPSGLVWCLQNGSGPRDGYWTDGNTCESGFSIVDGQDVLITQGDLSSRSTNGYAGPGTVVTLNANGTVTVLNPSDPDEAARIAKATGTEVQATQEEIITTDAATISDHITSAFMTVAENNGAGHVVNLVTGTQPYNQHTEVGRTVGHLITLGQGAFEIVHGVTIALGGGAGTVVTSPACATGIGCAIPAATATVSAVGVLEAMHGAGVIGLTIYNMVNDPWPGARGENSTLEPGPYAGESIPARNSGRRFTDEERDSINRIGGGTGCHTCGTKDPGTKSGNFVPDHQPASKLNPENKPQRLFPQCLGCSKRQGGQVRGKTR